MHRSEDKPDIIVIGVTIAMESIQQELSSNWYDRNY